MYMMYLIVKQVDVMKVRVSSGQLQNSSAISRFVGMNEYVPRGVNQFILYTSTKLVPLSQVRSLERREEVQAAREEDGRRSKMILIGCVVGVIPSYILTLS